MSATADDLARLGLLSPLDVHFAETLRRLAGESDERVRLAAALAARHVGSGHVCVDLPRLSQTPLAGEDGIVAGVEWPEAGDWLAALRQSPLVAVAGSGEERARPLVLDQRGRLYLQRYWQHEQRLAAAIRARVVVEAPSAPAKGRGAGGQIELWPEKRSSGAAAPPTRNEERGTRNVSTDWQKIAVAAATEQRFCVVSGGPGTGKTHIVVLILARLIERALAAGEALPRIQLLAPTGKAAARLRESIREKRAELVVADEVRGAIPEEAATVHRCLGRRRNSRTGFRHDADNPLRADVVIVDEASMVDLALMARLVDALPPAARLVLLGDENQLASVEAGAVLGDICNSGGERRHSQRFAEVVARAGGGVVPLQASAPRQSGIGDCVVRLERSYRYAEDSGIGALASAINAGDAERALAILASTVGDVQLLETSGKALDERAVDLAVSGFAAYLAEPDPPAQLERLREFRVLCALRRGPHGVEGVNRAIEAELERQGLVETGFGDGYRKQPILILENDYELELFNGDVGVIGEHADGSRAAWFATPQNEPRVIALSRLPPRETVFAMTVHKSQGSEVEQVAIVLPPEDAPLLSRELLYTAVSRARTRVTILGSRELVRAAIGRRIERASGLRDLLW